MASAVQDRLNLTPAEALHYLRVDDTEDEALVTDLLEGAKASADAFLNNPFTDADGNDLPIPAAVKSWVLRRVAMLYEQRIEGARGDEVHSLGRVDYGMRDEMGSADMALIRSFRRNPGL